MESGKKILTFTLFKKNISLNFIYFLYEMNRLILILKKMLIFFLG